MIKNIWIDLLNPSHPLFFKPIFEELKTINEIQITARDRAETVELSMQLKMPINVVGKFHKSKIKKTSSTVSRTFNLLKSVEKFDISLSFENAESIAVSKLRDKKSILFLDNDLKYKQKNDFIQKLENKIKLRSNHFIIPKVSEREFEKHIDLKKLYTYNGYKEDLYLADYKPDYTIRDQIPFKHFIIIRPEALGSFYVCGKRSIVPDLINFFHKQNINVVYLPRDREDTIFKECDNVFIPKKAINGLDLCFFSDAVLTGSGTMSREAACMGKASISFFPNKELLSVDAQLINEGKIFHSRNPKEIGEYVISRKPMEKTSALFSRSKKVKEEILEIIYDIIK